MKLSKKDRKEILFAIVESIDGLQKEEFHIDYKNDGNKKISSGDRNRILRIARDLKRLFAIRHRVMKA